MSILIVIYFCLDLKRSMQILSLNFFQMIFQIYMLFLVEDTTIHERKHSRENISGKREKKLSSIKM